MAEQSGFQTSYLPQRSVTSVKGSGIGQVTMPTLSDFLGFEPGRLNEIREAAGLSAQPEKQMKLFNPLQPIDVSTGGGFAPVGGYGDLSGLLQGIKNRQAQTSANLQAIDARDSDDLGSAPTAPKTITDQLSDLSKDLSSNENQSAMEAAAGLSGQGELISGSDTTDDAMSNQQKQTDAAGTTSTTTETTTTTTDTTQEGDGGDSQEAYNPYGVLLEKAMADVTALRGEDPNKKTKEDYMKEFAEATGVKIDGEPDKSHALMAFGLALMQNKAGKGFNVSNMLGAVGEAGEKAMPAFQKAKEQARAERIAAGKYALGEVKAATTARQASLKEANARVEGLLEKTVDAQSKMDLERVKQANQFKIKRQEHIYKMAEAQAEAAKEGVNLYLDKTEKIDLFKDAPSIFQVESFIQNPNLPKGTNAPVKLTNGSAQKLAPQLNAAERALDKAEQDLAAIGTDIKKGVTIQDQIMAKIGYGARSFGIDFGSNELTPVERARYALNSIATQKTPQILGEAGKTISDADRALVASIVGKIDLANADEATLLMKLNEVYSLVVERGRANLDTAYDTLHSYDYNYGPYAQQQAPSGDLSKEEQEELNQLKGA